MNLVAMYHDRTLTYYVAMLFLAQDHPQRDTLDTQSCQTGPQHLRVTQQSLAPLENNRSVMIGHYNTSLFL